MFCSSSAAPCLMKRRTAASYAAASGHAAGGVAVGQRDQAEYGGF
jgi:hypothetical protein